MRFGDFLNVQLITLNANRSACIGKGLQRFECQSAERFRSIGWQIPFSLPVDVANTDRARARGAPVGMPRDLLIFFDKV